MVSYALCTLLACERTYSQIAKEALALVFAAERFQIQIYIMDITITLETDHKPLLQILQTNPIDKLMPSLHRIRLRLMRCSYKIKYVPGRQ